MLHGFDSKKQKKQSKIARLHEHYQGIINKLMKELEKSKHGGTIEVAEGSLLPSLFSDVENDEQAVEGTRRGVQSEGDKGAEVGVSEEAVEAVEPEDKIKLNMTGRNFEEVKDFIEKMPKASDE